MNIHFTKMHGLGNDFIVIDNTTQQIKPEQLNISQLSDRRLGVGFDQLLIFSADSRMRGNDEATSSSLRMQGSLQHEPRFFCRIFNADGSEAEQCGNGLRCVARYIHENKLHPNSSFILETVSGRFPVSIHDYEHVQIAMNPPNISHPLIKLKDALAHLSLSILSIGNPHAVAVVDSLDTIPADDLASQISALDWFPQGTNVGFMQIISPSHIRLRTVERGAGETPACGSNACAAVTAGIINKQLANKVRVEYQYGSLTIEWQGEGKPILMTGPAEKVFDGFLSS